MTFVPIKWAALLKVSLLSEKIRVRFMPRCTIRKTTRKSPARDIISFLPMEELRMLLINRCLIAQGVENCLSIPLQIYPLRIIFTIMLKGIPNLDKI
jgi:hypothetical protein